MTIAEAIELLTPVAKRLNCSVNIDAPEVWLFDHRNWQPKVEPWRIYLSGPGSYYGATLEDVVRTVLNAHREAPELAGVQAAVSEIDALAIPTLELASVL